MKQFNELLIKFYNGRKWLSKKKAQGGDISEDSEEFYGKVIIPISRLYKKLSEGERKAFKSVDLVVETFKGRLVGWRENAAMPKVKEV